ncbi:hypothetical protein LCL89_08510 [Halobacillus yeomjeoni]|uniref:hypothetical protein n=1 Tax=Halobacillus yeomjeoni TaxID=311194 RepID=UPI001CD1BF1C|nr:hypothetical protein [Halobacillus yeomjeoni]MCA0984083.1 hypothetical protein [Halobacillus yeomjeoni]
MKKLILLAMFLLLVGCSSQDLALEDLKESYPDSFAKPVDSLSQRELADIGLPDELPFEVSNVEAEVEDEKVDVHYQSAGSEEVSVRTYFSPENILQESQLQVPLNSGAVAGVQEKEDYVFVEWYESEEDIVYQIKYSGGKKDKRTQQALEIANSI